MFICFVLPSNGQNQADNWYFGNRAGLNFNNCSPAILTDGELNTHEGVATISDATGNLLFYTDGITVWNRLHSIMSNGTGLFGHPSSTQSAVIVPRPGSLTHYYIFTPALENTNSGLRYSVVDMTANGGLGEVIEKNTLLSTGINEKVTAVRHVNNTDVWVISRAFNSFEYRSWLVNNTGIANAVISLSNYNPGLDYNKTRGYLKPSVDGTKLFCAFDDNLYSELSRFNAQTGQVYSTFQFKNIPGYLATFQNDRSGAYGVEFSSNGKYLYLSSFVADRNFYLSQFNVSTFDSAIIHQSATLIDSGFSTINPSASEYAALQLAKNGKIYIARLNSFFLSVINQPDLQGQACDLTFNGQYLGGRRSTLGLPTFNQTYFDPHFRNYEYSFSENCTMNVNFDLVTTDTYDSLKWDFGDPVSGPFNYSTNPSISHQYLTPGYKNVKLIVYNFVGCNVITDTITKNIQVGIDPPNLGVDTLVCIGQSLNLHAFSTRADSYLWSTNETTSSISAVNPGLYWVEVSTGSCILRDSIIITTKPYPTVDIGLDQEVCEGTSVTLNADNPGATYVWSDGSTLATYLVNQPGQFHVSVNLDGCISYDTVNISYLARPAFSLGTSTSICDNEVITLSPTLDSGWSLLWNDGTSDTKLNVIAPGIYSLIASNLCGSQSSSIEIKPGICAIYIPTVFTPNNDNLNDVFRISGTSNLVNYHLTIFNRYGQKVFESLDKTKVWTGILNGQPIEVGVFVYYFEFKKQGNSKFERRKGTILLLR